MPSSARCTNSRAGQPAAAKRGAAQCADHPDEGAPSATGRQSQKSQKMIACPKAGQNRRLHRSADPRRAEARTRRSASKRSFLLDRARPVSLLARPKGAPAAPRAVGRGGARERAQFSPQAETELSGLCDDDNGGRIPRGSGPLREQNPPWPPFGGPTGFPWSPRPSDFLPDQRRQEVDCPAGETSRSGMPGPAGSGTAPSAAPQKYFVKNSALDGNFSPLPCVSTGKRSRCSPESIGKDERE